MKKFLGIIVACLACVCLSSCEKDGTGRSNELAGQTFVYSNGYSGSWKIEQGYTFKSGGNVYYYSKVGYSPEFNTDGCGLYYTLDGDKLTIYHGVKGWKKEVRHTVFASGEYRGSYIIIEGKEFVKK